MESQRVPQRPQLDSRKNFLARQGIMVTDGLPILHRAPAEDRRPDQGLPRPLRRPAHACNTKHTQPPWLSQHHESLQQPSPDPNPRYGGAELRGEQARAWIRIQDPVHLSRAESLGKVALPLFIGGQLGQLQSPLPGLPRAALFQALAHSLSKCSLTHAQCLTPG